LCEAIKTTGSTLFEASITLKESTDESIKTLKHSIDDFRKDDERTSKVLIALTAVIGFAALVQAFYVIMLIFKK
jgi:phosphate uptake regulator